MSQQEQQYAGHDRRRRGCFDGTWYQINQRIQPVPPAMRHACGDVDEANEIGERAHDTRSP